MRFSQYSLGTDILIDKRIDFRHTSRTFVYFCSSEDGDQYSPKC